jgi:hypothetical protein
MYTCAEDTVVQPPRGDYATPACRVLLQKCANQHVENIYNGIKETFTSKRSVQIFLET